MTTHAALKALAESLGYHPEDVSRMTCSPGVVVVDHVIRDDAGRVMRDPITGPLIAVHVHPWTLDEEPPRRRRTRLNDRHTLWLWLTGRWGR